MEFAACNPMYGNPLTRRDDLRAAVLAFYHLNP
jgi:hypothetical protein